MGGDDRSRSPGRPAADRLSRSGRRNHRVNLAAALSGLGGICVRFVSNLINNFCAIFVTACGHWCEIWICDGRGADDWRRNRAYHHFQLDAVVLLNPLPERRRRSACRN